MRFVFSVQNSVMFHPVEVALDLPLGRPLYAHCGIHLLPGTGSLAQAHRFLLHLDRVLDDSRSPAHRGLLRDLLSLAIKI